MSNRYVEFIQYFRKHVISDSGKVSYSGSIRGAFAIRVDTQTNMIQVGHSLQNRNDEYDRDRGVFIANGRMNKCRPHTVSEDIHGMHRFDYEILYNPDGSLKDESTHKKSSVISKFANYHVIDEQGSPATGGHAIPWAMREFYQDIIIPRIVRILNPKVDKIIKEETFGEKPARRDSFFSNKSTR